MKRLIEQRYSNVLYPDGVIAQYLSGMRLHFIQNEENMECMLNSNQLTHIRTFTENGKRNFQNISFIGKDSLDIKQIDFVKLINYKNKICALTIRYETLSGEKVINESFIYVNDIEHYTQLISLYNQETTKMYLFSNDFQIKKEVHGINYLKGNEQFKKFLLKVNLDNVKEYTGFNHDFEKLKNEYFIKCDPRFLESIPENQVYIYIE